MLRKNNVRDVLLENYQTFGDGGKHKIIAMN
jgi:hypothetical protein